MKSHGFRMTIHSLAVVLLMTASLRGDETTGPPCDKACRERRFFQIGNNACKMYRYRECLLCTTLQCLPNPADRGSIRSHNATLFLKCEPFGRQQRAVDMESCTAMCGGPGEAAEGPNTYSDIMEDTWQGVGRPVRKCVYFYTNADGENVRAEDYPYQWDDEPFDPNF